MSDRKVLVSAGKNNFTQIPATDVAEVGNGVTSSLGGSLGLFGSTIIAAAKVVPNDHGTLDLGENAYSWKEIHGLKVKTDELSRKTDSAIIERVCDLHWHSLQVGGSDSWVTSEDGTPQQNSTDVNAKLFLELNFIHGSKIDSLKFRYVAVGSVLDPLPGNFPTFNVIKQTYANNSTAGIGTTSLFSLGSGYRGANHEVIVDCSQEEVDNTQYRYYVLVTPESGSDSQAGGLLLGMKKLYVVPANIALAQE